MDVGDAETWTQQGRLGLTILAGEAINQIDFGSATQELSFCHTTSKLWDRNTWFYCETMKGDRKKKPSLFKKGHVFFPQNRETDTKCETNEEVEVKYVRPTEEEANLVDQAPILPLALMSDQDSDPRPPTVYKLLRSKKAETTINSDCDATEQDIR